ncbi:MAG TPA: YcgL domain-containing protein [Marinagarivorans sp.]
MQKIICDIYRSPKKEGLYLYVPKQKGLADVPEALMGMFGKPLLAFSLLLTPEKKLGKEDIVKVLASLDEKGYFLQLPPSDQDDYMQDINQHNSKLAK